MSSATITSLDGVLKVYYTDFKVKLMQYGESTLLSVMNRMTKFAGKNLPIPILFNTPQGRGTTIARAQAAAVPAQTTDFVLTRASDYGVVTISNEALEAAEEGDKAAFLTAKVTEIDGIFKQLVRSLSTATYGTGSGSIGRVGSISAGVYIQLTDIDQIANFDVGMVISASQATSETTPRVGTMTITGIDEDLGRIYGVTTDIAALSASSSGDYLQVSGDLSAKVAGLAGWVPASQPSATAWFGVDRTANYNKLGGIRISTTVAPAGVSPEERLMRALARASRSGARPDLVVMNNTRFADLEASMAGRITRGMVETEDAEFGFKSIKIMSGTTEVDVLADPYCPNAYTWGLQTDTWKLYSLKDIPRFEQGDGLMMLRQSTADGVEVRAKYYGQIGCTAPGYNFIMAW